MSAEKITRCKCSENYYGIMECLRMARETPIKLHAGDLMRFDLDEFYRDCLGQPLPYQQLEQLIEEANDDPEAFREKIKSVVSKCKEGR